MDPVGTITWHENAHVKKPHEVGTFLSEIVPDTYNGLQALSAKLSYLQSPETQNRETRL